MQIDKALQKASIALSIFLIATSSVWSAAARVPGLYNMGTGVTLGLIYNPASPAIDLRNIMGSTWNLSNGNRYLEKYLFKPPYQGSMLTYRQTEKAAAAHGLRALFGNDFKQNQLIAVEIFEPQVLTHNRNLFHLQSHQLINFSVHEPLLVRGQVNPENHQALIVATTMKKVLDNSINLQGIKQARYMHLRMGKLSLTEQGPRQPRTTSKASRPHHYTSRIQ